MLAIRKLYDVRVIRISEVYPKGFNLGEKPGSVLFGDDAAELTSRVRRDEAGWEGMRHAQASTEHNFQADVRPRKGDHCTGKEQLK